MSPKFERISCTKDINRVRQIEAQLLKRLPESVHILVLLKLVSDQRLPKEIDTQLYIYVNDDNEDWKEGIQEDNDDLFIVCIQRPNFHTMKGIVMLTPRNPTTKHIEAFDAFIGWDEPQVFQCCSPSFWNAIRKLSLSHGKLIPENEEGIPGEFYAIMDLEKAKNLEVKDLTSNNPNFNVRSLESADVPKAIEHWKWAATHSKEVVGFCVGTLPSCGVFHNGEMASSVLMSPLGAFNALYTLEKFRNRGLGQFVMRWISRETARVFGTFPLAEVEVWNEPSKKTLINAGYEPMYLTNWYYYEPTN